MTPTQKRIMDLLLLRLSAQTRRYDNLKGRVWKLTQARDKWQARATRYQKELNSTRKEARRQKARAELWKTRALRREES
jgi:hypothetical protein